MTTTTEPADTPAKARRKVSPFKPGKFYCVKVARSMVIAGLRVRPRDRPVFDGAKLIDHADDIVSFEEVTYGQ